MPIYEYQCTDCQHRLEALQKISDAPLVTCPACGKPGLCKLVSAASFRLKGGGWYETDFKKDGRKQLADSEAGAKAGDDGKADGKGDDGRAGDKAAATEAGDKTGGERNKDNKGIKGDKQAASGGGAAKEISTAQPGGD